MVWVGPGSEDVLADFLSWHGRRVDLDPDVFCNIDSDEAKQDVVKCLAMNRGCYPNALQLKELRDQWPSLLPLGQQSTYQHLTNQFKDGLHTGLSGACIADLSQSLERLRCGPWVPTLARSTVLCSVSKRHLFSPDEVDVCMGWPSIVFEENTVYAEALGLQLDHSTRHARRSLSGNSMMLCQVMDWFLYCFFHTLRRDLLEKICPSLQTSSVDLETGSDEDDMEMYVVALQR
jgi:hypothetical protein